MNLSVFPNQIDEFVEHYDIQPSDLPNIRRYQELKQKSYLTAEEQNELMNLTHTLRDKVFLAEDFNKLQDCITNLEEFFKENTEEYLDDLKEDLDNRCNQALEDIENSRQEIIDTAKEYTTQSFVYYQTWTATDGQNEYDIFEGSEVIQAGTVLDFEEKNMDLYINGDLMNTDYYDFTDNADGVKTVITIVPELASTIVTGQKVIAKWVRNIGKLYHSHAYMHKKGGADELVIDEAMLDEALRNKVNSNQDQEVSDLRTEVNGLKTDVGTLKTDNTSNKNEISNIKQEISKMATSTHTHSNLKVIDSRNVASKPSDYIQEMKVQFKSGSAAGLGSGINHASLMGIKGWTDDTGGRSHELAFLDNGDIYHRSGSGDSWLAWQNIKDGGNASKLGGKAVADFSLSNHTHNYAAANHSHNNYAPTSHTHNYAPNNGIASTAEAQAGTNDAKYMTPLKVKQAVQAFGMTGLDWARIYTGGGTLSGSSNVDQTMSPRQVEGNVAVASGNGLKFTKTGTYLVLGEMGTSEVRSGGASGVNLNFSFGGMNIGYAALDVNPKMFYSMTPIGKITVSDLNKVYTVYVQASPMYSGQSFTIDFGNIEYYAIRLQ